MSASGRCKAIAVSTGQQCTRSGKLDGYCSEKHKEQASSLWSGRKPGASPFTDSEDDDSEGKKSAAKKGSKTTKALKALGIQKTAAVDDDDKATRLAPVSVVEPKAKKATATKAKAAPAPRKAAAAGRKKKVVESSDEFEPESDGDYAPGDSEDVDSDESDDSDDDDDSDDVDELSGKMASIKIQPNDTTPSKEGDGPLKTKIKRTKSKIVNTGAVLAPPKNKTKASSASGRPTGGFWVPAPAPVKLPESSIKILSVIKEKLLDRHDSDDAIAPIKNPHDAPDKKPSGFFKYQVRMQNYLHSNEEEEDPESKRAAVRRLFHNIGSMFKPKKTITDSPTAPEKKPEKKPEKEKIGGMVTTTKPSGGRRGSQDSVDSITKNINDLSVKADDDSDDESPNQCHGFNTSGHRCKRKVKLDRPQEKGEVLMCHDHEVNEEDEVVVHIEGKGGVLLQWLDVSVWVNPNLPDYVQNKLRKAMERPVSETDKPGYIYVYQLLETRSTDTHTLFKVGRTDNVHRRMNEWSDKCGSPPILLEVFPEQGALAPKDDNDLAENSKAEDDTVITGLRCRYAHRVERLIHIELKPFHDKHHTCPCKTKHMEWFMIPNQPGLSEKQQLKQAWVQVRRVIVHWMNYMERVYGPG
ncbi:MAG: meiotically up-regulated gene 113-domain-containing protein [Linnemannia gamsii]|nr:MAG: meiotically up-regulated gene 113-domain-containing protein [Linnemannia gamsii]